MSGYSRERARELMHRLMLADRMHRAALEEYIGVQGIHRSQHMLLMYLERKKGCVSQKGIAKEFDISPAAVAVTLKKLEAGGYVERNVREGDNRVNEISITEKGREIVEKSRKWFDNVDRQMFCEFTDEEYAVMGRCFDKMINGLKDFDGKTLGKE